MTDMTATTSLKSGCWAHARRKFVEALPTDKELIPTSMAAKGVNLINELYEIERSFDGRFPKMFA